MVEELKQFLRKNLGKNYDKYETQIQKWKREVIIRNANDFVLLAKNANIKELNQTCQGNLYFELSFSPSHIDRWQFELTSDKYQFIRKHGKQFEYQKNKR